MHKRTLIWLLAIVCLPGLSSTTVGAAQNTNGGEYTGTWSGTWDGSGSGNFELTLEKAKDGATAGKVVAAKTAGTWSLRPKGGGAELLGGSFTVSKK